MMKGLFVTFEGGEGAGKSSLIQNLYDRLTAQGVSVVKTREPGGCALAEEVRRLLLDPGTGIPVGKRAELLLFLAARAQHVEELIEPALQAGSVVLCDRYNDSTLAYQGGARGAGAEEVLGLCRSATSGLEPDLTFLLDVSPDIGLRRSRGVAKAEAAIGSGDRMESEAIEFHERVRAAFLEIASLNTQRVRVLDAHSSQEEIQAEAWHILSATRS